MTSAVTDFAQYDRMRLDASANDPAVLREVAGQFEALFVQTLLKNMRAGSLGDPIFGDNNQHEMYQEMLDKQLAVEMSKGRGIGLADMLVLQLGGDIADLPVAPGLNYPMPAMSWGRGLHAETPTGRVAAARRDGEIARWNSPVDFARQIWPHAERAATTLDIMPEALIAQAALETGWGAQVADRPDGSSSFNLFGIKAAAGWNGATVVKATLEYRDGIAYREVAQFRAYPDLAASFDDYVAVVGGLPRYASVPGNGSDARAFALALQEAGYATDPKYADKLYSVVNGETMREALQTIKNDESSPMNKLVSPDLSE